MKELNDGYPELFQKDAEEGVQEGKRSDEEGGTDESDGSSSDNSFGAK